MKIHNYGRYFQHLSHTQLLENLDKTSGGILNNLVTILTNGTSGTCRKHSTQEQQNTLFFFSWTHNAYSKGGHNLDNKAKINKF